MKTPRFLARFIELRPGETRIALLAFVVLLLTSAGYTILETARDALLVTRLPQHDFGLPYLAVAACALPASTVLARVARRWDPRRVLLALLLVAATGVLVFTALPLHGVVTVVAFYVTAGLVSSAVFPQFWVLLGTQLTVGQGRRLISPISAAAVVGAVAGAALAAGVFSMLPVRGLMAMASAIFALAAAAAFFVPPLPLPRDRPAPKGGVNPPLAKSVNAFREEPFLVRVALLVVVTTATALVIDYLFKTTIARTIPGPARGVFIARYYAVVNVIALVVQIFLGSVIVRGLGVSTAMILTPFLSLVGGTAALVASAFAVPVLVLKAADGSLRSSINRLTTELVYLPVSPSGRERAKPFIDGALVRIAQAVTAGALLGLTTLNLLTPLVLAAIVVALSFAWLIAAVTMRSHYLGQLRRSVVPTLVDDRASVEFDLASAELVIEHLGSDDPQVVLAAMNTLARRGRERLIPALVLRHPDEQVLRRALELFALGPSTRTDWHTLAGGLVEHADDGVRIAAASALAAQGKLDFDRLAADSSPGVRGYAALHAAMVGPSDDLVADPRVATVLRGDAAAVMGLLAAVADAEPSTRVARVLLALAEVEGPPNSGAWAALLARATLRQGELRMIPHLIERLTRWEGREAIRAALVELGEPAFIQVAAALEDTKRERRLRVHLPQTLGRFGTSTAAYHLLERVEREPDGLVRYKSLRALGRLVNDLRIKVDRGRVERCLKANLVTYFELLGLRVALGAPPPPDQRAQASTFRLLAGLLDDKLRQSLERAFRLLKIAFPKEDIHRVYLACIGADKRGRANAAEFLDALLRRRHEQLLRELVRIVADDLPPPAKVARASLLLGLKTPRTAEEAVQAALADADIKVAALAALYAVAAGGTLTDSLQLAQARRPSLAPATQGLFQDALPAMASLPPSARVAPADAKGEDSPVADESLQRTSRELFFSVLTGGAGKLETWVIDRMTSVVEEEDVEAGKRLFAAGEQPEFIFFIREGRVRLEREGGETWLFEGRSVIGAFDALLERPHARTAVAETPIHILRLRVDSWLDLLEDSLGLARAALGNAVATVSAAEARRWALSKEPRGDVLATVPPLEGPMAFVERLAVLADVSLVRNAGIQVLVELADSIEEVTFEPGAVIVERGKWRGRAFLVLSGEAEGERHVSGTPDLRVLFGPGSFVAGVASLGEPILAWQVHAVTRMRALSMRLEDWFDLMEEHFDLVRSALSELALLRETILDELAAKQGALRFG